MASRDMNHWHATGRVGTIPEMRFTPGGQTVTEFRFAVGRSWRDAQGERKEATTWITVVCWGQLAEFANTHLSKGERIGLSGRLDLHEWDDRESGERRSKYVATASDLYFLEGRRELQEESGALRRAGADQEPVVLAEDEIPF